MKNEFIIGRRVGRYQLDARRQLIGLLTEAGLLASPTAEESGENQTLDQGEPLTYRLTATSPWLIRCLDDLIKRRDEAPLPLGEGGDERGDHVR